jgi:hypothetical protein
MARHGMAWHVRHRVALIYDSTPAKIMMALSLSQPQNPLHLLVALTADRQTITARRSLIRPIHQGNTLNLHTESQPSPSNSESLQGQARRRNPRAEAGFPTKLPHVRTKVAALRSRCGFWSETPRPVNRPSTSRSHLTRPHALSPVSDAARSKRHA